jgi:hypothetical protein
VTDVQARPGRRTAWGIEAVIDLYGCDPGRLRDPGVWRAFIANLVTVIGVKAHGELRLERSGQGDLCDWSAVQPLVTGSITGQGDEAGLRCFCNVISCCEFDPVAAATVAAAYFGGAHTLQVLRRGASPPTAEAPR